MTARVEVELLELRAIFVSCLHVLGDDLAGDRRGNGIIIVGFLLIVRIALGQLSLPEPGSTAS